MQSEARWEGRDGGSDDDDNNDNDDNWKDCRKWHQVRKPKQTMTMLITTERTAEKGTE